MKDSTKHIIVGAGITSFIVGLVSYGVGYYRGGLYAIEQSKKEFEDVIDDIYTEQNRHLDETIKTYESLIENLQDVIENQEKRGEKLWNALNNNEKSFIVNDIL